MSWYLASLRTQDRAAEGRPLTLRKLVPRGRAEPTTSAEASLVGGSPCPVEGSALGGSDTGPGKPSETTVIRTQQADLQTKWLPVHGEVYPLHPLHDVGFPQTPDCRQTKGLPWRSLICDSKQMVRLGSYIAKILYYFLAPRWMWMWVCVFLPRGLVCEAS